MKRYNAGLLTVYNLKRIRMAIDKKFALFCFLKTCYLQLNPTGLLFAIFNFIH